MTPASAARVVLFIEIKGSEQTAAGQFESVARTFRLPWTVMSRSVSGEGGPSLSADDLSRATVAIGIDQTRLAPLLVEQFPTVADRIEYWDADAVEREVTNLVARLLGGKRSDETPLPPPPPPAPARKPAPVRVGRETAGRRGKGVTTVWDLPLDDNGIRELAALLKQRCGTGGTVKDGKIEIQGEHRDRIAAELEKMGYKVKRSGG